MGQINEPAEQIRAALEVLHEPGSVFEIRAFHSVTKAVAAGCFDNVDAATREAFLLDKGGFNVFTTLNPVAGDTEPELNRIIHHPRRATTAGDIIRRAWMLIDIDPVRPSGVGSTDAECAATSATGQAIREHLSGLGWPLPVLATSGNGVHLLYRVDLQNNQDAARIVSGCLRTIALGFDTATVKVDQSVADAPRISRLWGTVNKKGANTPDRQHRRAYALEVPDELQIVPTALLEALAAQPVALSAPSAPPAARVPAERLLDAAVDRVASGAHRNPTGLFFFCQLRDNGYSRAEAELILNSWVTRANDAKPGTERYPIKDAQATLKQAYKREARKPTVGAPVVGGGLVQEIDKAIKKDNHFARDEGGRLYVFEGGCYRPTGERFVQQAVKAYTQRNGKDKAWTPELASRVTEYIAVDAPQLLARPPLDELNVKNGLLNVTTRALRPHSPDFLSPVQIEANFDPAAPCPAIDQFVSDVFPADAQQVPWEVTAWLMTPDVSIQKAVLTLGEGANGKSVFLDLLRAFLGRGNVTGLSLHKIESDKFAAARLVGMLANICPDLPTAALSGTSMFKALTGGDTINAERKFEGSFEFQPYARLVFSANSAPRSDDATHGFFRRWLVIPFTRTFDEKDARTVPRAVLDARLSAPGELSGLLNRALDALPQIRAGRFTDSPTLRAAWDSFRSTTDPLAVWLESVTVNVPDGVIEKAKLRDMYRSECKDKGHPILSDEVFTKRLISLRPKVRSTQRRINKKVTFCFIGIGLRADEMEMEF